METHENPMKNKRPSQPPDGHQDQAASASDDLSPETARPKLGGLAALRMGRLPSLDALPDPPGPTEAQETPLPSAPSMERARRLAANYSKKSGTFLHPDSSVTEAVLLGLGRHLDELGRTLCPCRFYPDKQKEAEHRTWICPCDDMQVYKYCHCLLFTNEEGKPITEHLPADHEGRRIWGLVRDPAPEQGRALRHRAPEREEERRRRRS